MNLLQFADLHPWWTSLWFCWSLVMVGFCVDRFAEAVLTPRMKR